MERKVNWESAIKDLVFHHPDPSTTITVTAVPRAHHLKILFTFGNLVDSQTLGRLETLEYYFYANHWPGTEKARLWTLAVWALFMEHEALELTYLNGAQFADPHTSNWCAAHRKALERRHDMEYMISRICA